MKTGILSIVITIAVVFGVRYLIINNRILQSLTGSSTANTKSVNKNENINSNLVDAYNRLSKDAESFYTSYGNSIDWEKGPTVKDIKSDIHLSLLNMNDINFHHDVTDKLKSFIDNNLDSSSKLAKSYFNSFYDLEKQASLIDNYYSHKEYKDDNFKKGEILHVAFKKLFEAYWSEEDKIKNYLDEQEDIELNKEMKEAKRNSDLEYDYLTVLSSAKKVLRASKKISTKKGFTNFQNINGQFENEFNALKNEFEKNKIKMNSSHGDQQTLAGELENFINGCDQLLIDNNSLIRKTLTPEKEEKTIATISEDIKKKYNSVIERSNELGNYMSGSDNSVWVTKN